MFYAHLTLFCFVLQRLNCNRIHYNIHIKFFFILVVFFLFLFLQFENGFPFFLFIFAAVFFWNCVYMQQRRWLIKIRFTCKNHKNLIYTFVYLIRRIYIYKIHSICFVDCQLPLSFEIAFFSNKLWFFLFLFFVAVTQTKKKQKPTQKKTWRKYVCVLPCYLK